MLAGVAVANLFTPAVYYYQGAAAAGRFGLGMAIAQAVAGFMSVWLNCKVPQIALLTAEQRYAELRLLFRHTKQSAAAVAVLAGAAAIALLGLLARLDPVLGARIPPAATLLVLLAAAVLQQYILTLAVFARAHKREPLLVPSLLLACATPCLLALLVPAQGALGAALGYLLPVLLVSVPYGYVINRQMRAAMAERGQPASRKHDPLALMRRYLRGLFVLRYCRGELELIRLMAHPALAGLARRRPRVLFKYLHQRYLAARLDSASRLAILMHHYRSLVRALPAPRLRTLLQRGLVLWKQEDEQASLHITLSFSHHDLEGELMLKLWIGDMRIYYLTLALADGKAIGSAPGPVLLITCLQGRANELALIREATRAGAHTQPPYLLLAAAEGLAEALGAERIVAVGNTQQLGKAAGRAQFDYDSFWASQGGVPTAAGFYEFAAQLPEKPLQAYPSRHRSREARKREIKRDIAQAVVRGLLEDTATASPSQS
jgi:uncharacterized protein VirK/YbjX